MIVVDATIVNVALPSIQKDLGFSQAGLAWVVNAYLIAYGGLLLLAGRLGDLIGHRRIFIIGLAMFSAASLLCGLSFNGPMLIAARFLQGIGGAVASAVILGMVATMFPEPADRARAMGVFAFVASAGASIGLVAGGLITQAISWHWIFFVNLPIGLVTAILAARLIEPDTALGLRQGADLIGACLVTVGLMLGVYTIVESPTYGLGSLRTVGLGLLAIALLTVFVIRQAVIRNPILPLRLFRSRNVSLANFVQGLTVVGMFGMFFLGSLDLERVLHYGPMAIGLAFLPVAVSMGTLSLWLSARLIMRFGVPAMVVGGQILMALALILLAAGPMDSNYARNLLAPMLLVGVGGGIAFPALAMLAMSDVAPGDSGLASGLLNTTAQVGGALGLAVLATVSTNRTNELLAASQPLARSLSAGFHLAWGVGAGLIVFSIIVSAIVFLAKSAKDADQADELEASA
jgi:EmrB/QacA subfamily drug resistance transporter